MNWIAKHWDLFMGQRVPFSSTQGYVFFINIHGGKISSDLPIARGFNKMASKCSFQPKLACDSIHSYKPNLIPFSCLSGDTHRMGKLPRLFLRTQMKTYPDKGHTVYCVVSERLCESSLMILSGLETPWMEHTLWDVGLPSAGVSFSPSTVFLSLPRNQNDI